MLNERRLYRVRYHGPDWEDTRLVWTFFRACNGQDAAEQAKAHLNHAGLLGKRVFLHIEADVDDEKHATRLAKTAFTARQDRSK